MSLLNFTIFTLIAITLGHRSLPDGATCGPQAEPLNIPDPKISWASYRIISCEDPTFRLSGEFDANQYVAFSLGLPLLERFRDVLLNVLVVGPGLPQLSEDDRAKLHPSIIDFQPEQGMGALVFESPLDQSSCGHMKEVMTEATHVQDDRCVFYEPFGGSSSWSVLDEEFHTADAGTYEFIVYSSTGTNAKIWFACCDWPEDFITQYELPEPECEYNCETLETENMWLWQQLFYEYAGMEQYGGFPALQVCADDSSPQEPPTGDQCPSVNDFCKDDDEGMAKFIGNFGSQATTCAEAPDWCQHAEFGEMVRALCMVTCGECTIDCENDNEGVVGLVANFMPFVKGCDDLIELCDDPEFGQTVGTYCPLTCGLCEASSDLNGYDCFEVTHQPQYDLGEQNGVTFSDCGAMCTAYESCRSFDYQADTETCWLQSTRQAAVTGHNTITYCQKNDGISVAVYEKQANKHNPGKNVQPALFDVSLEYCENACNLNSLCKSFDYHRTEHRCYLNQDTGSETALRYHGVIDYYEKRTDPHYVAGSYSCVDGYQQTGLDIYATGTFIHIAEEDCIRMCDSTDSCKSYDYSNILSQCWISFADLYMGNTLDENPHMKYCEKDQAVDPYPSRACIAAGSGNLCIFPFTIFGRTYNSCFGSPGSAPQCATQVDNSGNAVSTEACNLDRCRTYVCYENTHQPKHDRYVKYIHSKDECQSQCDADDKCVSYDFIPDHGMETGRCYIQNAGMCNSDFQMHLGATYCEVDHVSDIYTVEFECVPQTHQPKHDLDVLENVTQEICEKKCACRDDCLSFDYHTITHKCWLSSSKSANNMAHGVITYCFRK